MHSGLKCPAIRDSSLNNCFAFGIVIALTTQATARDTHTGRARPQWLQRTRRALIVDAGGAAAGSGTSNGARHRVAAHGAHRKTRQALERTGNAVRPCGTSPPQHHLLQQRLTAASASERFLLSCVLTSHECTHPKSQPQPSDKCLV